MTTVRSTPSKSTTRSPRLPSRRHALGRARGPCRGGGGEDQRAGGGGHNASGAVGTADIIDADTGGVVTVTMTAARDGASATALLDGRVLVAGGWDGTNDLLTAEVIDPASATTTATLPMGSPRRNPQALLLDHNATVLVHGRARNVGAVVPTAEAFVRGVQPVSGTVHHQSRQGHARGALTSATRRGWHRRCWPRARAPTDALGRATEVMYGYRDVEDAPREITTRGKFVRSPVRDGSHGRDVHRPGCCTNRAAMPTRIFRWTPSLTGNGNFTKRRVGSE
jgi:hypothetical protein